MNYPTAYRTLQVDGLSISTERPDLKMRLCFSCTDFLLPRRGCQPLFARLSDRYHLIAPDYPGFSDK